MKEVKMINKEDDGNVKTKRDRAVKLTYAQLQQIIAQNVEKTNMKSYTLYNKDTVRTYMQNPSSNLSSIIEVSRFLERNSVLYKKIIAYYAAMPLFRYNLIQEHDWTKSITSKKLLSTYYSVSKNLHGFDIKSEMYNAIYCAVRDGLYVGYTYSSDESHFMMPLDIKYCKLYGKNDAGQWIVSFNAEFFDKDNNLIYVKGIDGNTNVGVWDEVFIKGYDDYKNKKAGKWFNLPCEKTFCLIAGTDDNFALPLPYFAGLLTSLMDIADLEAILASKTELENYKLLVSKIPLISSSDDVDDFSISLDLAQMFDQMLENAVPDLVGHVISPMDLDVIDFNKSNTNEDTDKMSQSVQNLFNNAGVSQLVVAGGASTNSVGLKHALENDMSIVWVFVERIERWLTYYVRKNIDNDFSVKIHPISWYNEKDYIDMVKEAATLGGSAMDYLTALGDTPYLAYQKLNWENATDIKSLMKPLSSSYTQSSKDTGGAPTKDEDDLTESGESTRANDKNGTENI